MREYWQELKNFFRKGDLVLLMICLATSCFGFVVISSVTNATKFGTDTRYLPVQIISTIIGVLAYILVSSLDTSILTEHRTLLTVFTLSAL